MTRLVEIAADPELVAQARRGDDRARRELYERLAPAVFGLIRRMVGGRAQAEDLFQDTMIAFYEKLDSYRGVAPLGAWARQIAISKCLMYLRSPWQRARLQMDRLDPESVGRAVSDPSPETLDVERALGSLSATARTVVWLYEVEGYSHQEIAQAFGRTVSFSKSQLARAHLRLRHWFEPQGGQGQPCT